MSDIILHHYPMSPFAEKVRLILGFKKLAWKSVTIPMYMPTAGELVAATRTRYTVRRHDPRAGSVQVHFPRVGFILKKAE
jgi:hypothetical protein